MSNTSNLRRLGDYIVLHGTAININRIVSIKGDGAGNTNIRTDDGIVTLFSGVYPEDVIKSAFKLNRIKNDEQSRN